MIKHAQIFSMILVQIFSIEGPLVINFGLDFIMFLVKNLYLLTDRTRFNEFINVTLGYNISKLIIQILLKTRSYHLNLSLKKVNYDSPIRLKRESPAKIKFNGE